MENFLWLLLIAGGGYFLVRWVINAGKNDEKMVSQLLSKYDLTILELTGYNCTYIGGHPDQNVETTAVVVGAKNGKLIFFQGALLNYGENLSTKGLLGSANNGFKHIFDISIESIADIRYFDATTSRTVGLVGVSHFAIPINMKQGDASVLIDWTDGTFSHSTEFRITGSAANYRANTLRNRLMQMVKENKK